MKYNIREMKKQERILLNEFLYEVTFIPEGMQAPKRNIINQPELQVDVADLEDKKDDICFVAEVEKIVIGAVWGRDMDDYGHVEEGIPSFAISLYKEYRGYGMGTEFMKKCLKI